jgi:hypothetical protein
MYIYAIYIYYTCIYYIYVNANVNVHTHTQTHRYMFIHVSVARTNYPSRVLALWAPETLHLQKLPPYFTIFDLPVPSVKSNLF